MAREFTSSVERTFACTGESQFTNCSERKNTSDLESKSTSHLSLIILVLPPYFSLLFSLILYESPSILYILA